MRNLCQCDKCKKLVKMVMSADWSIPIEWTSTDIGDLCPDCNRKYKQIQEGFLKAN